MIGPRRYRKRCEDCRYLLTTFTKNKRTCPQCGGWLIKETPVRKKRCWHDWKATSYMKSTQTGRYISDHEQCTKCKKVQHRVLGVVGGRSHSWFKAGVRE